MSKIYRSSIMLWALVICGLLNSASAGKPDGSPKPNLIVILSDDQGYADLSCYGAEGFKTPVLDRLAAQGVRFTDFYASPWCSPSRASLMTGRHYQRVGITCPINSPELGLAGDEFTIAEFLKNQGYATGLIGKWHLGLHESMTPIAQGFDYFSGIPLSHIRRGETEHTDGPSAYYRRQWRKMVPGKEDEIEFEPDDVQFTQRITDESVEFICKHRDHPFFLFVSHAQVHAEVLASEKFRGTSDKGVWGDSIQEMDASVGRIVAALRKHGIENNTLLVFCSDNGPQHKSSSTKPLRGHKGQTLEGGIRVPCVMSWPGRMPGGIECGQVASLMDIMPTMAAILDQPLPDELIMDGKDIRSLMTDPDAKSPHEAYYYYKGDFGKFQTGDDTSASLVGVRSGPWKLHLSDEQGWQLFDLKKDPGERQDVAGKHPEVVTRLRQMLDEARKDLGEKGKRGANVRALGRVSASEVEKIVETYRGK